ncbi:tetratricopeptide repeat protein [Candidatus Uabimicrobium sp. HlEnr_7]|uniref:tetratricopeptide repeat protein n=1 Tax=Candidatus Uabimicrobium helgolandensis TaxID=3095367 RepID=UPI003558CA4C
MDLSVEKKANLFALLCLALYLELQILPEIFISLLEIKPIIRDGFIFITFSVALFAILFFRDENIIVRKKVNLVFIAAHIAFFVGFVLLLQYLKNVNFQQEWPKDHILIQLASYFKTNVRYLTVVYRIEILAVGLLCHFTLVCAFFKIKYATVLYLLAFPIGILANEVYGVLLCPLLLLNFWLSPYLHIRRFSALAFGLALSTIFNKQLWVLLSYSVAKINVLFLELCFNNTVARFEGHNPIIGTTDFFVYIADKCSGMEGITTFIVAFFAIFLPVFREIYKIRVLVVCVVGFTLMYFMNVVRIFVLILLGHFFASQTIVNAWHSYGSMILYTATIYLFFTATYRWCKLPQAEIDKNNQNLANVIERSFFEKMEYYTPIVLRFPVDMMLLFFHMLWINITKLSIFAFIFKRNCQHFGTRPDEYGEDVVVYYCRATKFYGSPQMVNGVCPLVDLTKQDNKYYGCKAQSAKPKIFFWRFLVVAGFYIVAGACIFGSFRIYQIYKDTQQTTNVKEARHLDLIFEAENFISKKKYIEAEKRLLQALSLKLRSAKALYLLGNVYELLEQNSIRQIDPTQIFQQYLMATQLEPQMVEAQLRICYLGVWSTSIVDQIYDKIKKLRILGVDENECDALLAAVFFVSKDKKQAKKIIDRLYPKTNLALVHYLKAMFFIEENNLARAEKELNIAKKNPIFYTRSILKLAEVYLRLEQFDIAEKALNDLAESRYSIDADLALVRYYFIRKSKKKAIDHHYKLKKKIGNNLAVAEMLGELLLLYRAFDEALEIAIEYIDKFPKSIPLRLVAAKVYFNRGLYIEMVELCEYVLQRKTSDKNLAFASSLLGDMHRLKGNDKLALQAYQNLTKLFPNTAYSHYILGELFYEKGKYKEALAEYNKAIDKNPKNPISYIGKARAFTTMKKWSNTINQLKIAQKMGAQPVLIANLRGSMYEEMGKLNKADAIYRETIERFPQKSATTAHRLAKMKLRQGKKLGEALSYAFLAVRSSNIAAYRYTLAKIYYEMKQWKECGLITQNLIKQQGQNGDYLYLHGLVLNKLGINLQAIQYLRDARLLIIDEQKKQKIQKLIEKLQKK